MTNSSTKRKLLLQKITLDSIALILFGLLTYLILFGRILIAKLTQKDKTYESLLNNVPIINLASSLLLALIAFIALIYLYQYLMNLPISSKTNSNKSLNQSDSKKLI